MHRNNHPQPPEVPKILPYLLGVNGIMLGLIGPMATSIPVDTTAASGATTILMIVALFFHIISAHSVALISVASAARIPTLVAVASISTLFGSLAFPAALLIRFYPTVTLIVFAVLCLITALCLVLMAMLAFITLRRSG